MNNMVSLYVCETDINIIVYDSISVGYSYVALSLVLLSSALSQVW
jgi:hypothetical protein